MFLAVDRNNGMFDKETSDQINVRINNLDNSTKKIGQGNKERDHYYGDCRALPISFHVNVINDASMQYGKVKIINFSFRMSDGIRIIAEVPGYEARNDIFCNASDNEGNSSVVSISKKGVIRFANNAALSGEVAIYVLVIQ